MIRGNGPVLHKTDAFAMNLVAYKWHGTSAKLLQSTFRDGGPDLATAPLLRGLEIALAGKKMGSRVLAILPPAYAFGSSGYSRPASDPAGWDSGLLGVRTGSRILMVVPPSEGYGSAGNQQAGIRGTDTIVFVIDVLGTVSPS